MRAKPGCVMVADRCLVLPAACHTATAPVGPKHMLITGVQSKNTVHFHLFVSLAAVRKQCCLSILLTLLNCGMVL